MQMLFSFLFVFERGRGSQASGEETFHIQEHSLHLPPGWSYDSNSLDGI